MSWQDPIVGGTALRIPAIQSPNYAAGSTGWTINIDGSAEFNNLTVRGTFVGTSYVINADGAFFYSGTPAAGNLIASIAANPGTDSFGNPYVAGVSTQSGALSGDQFGNMSQGNLFLGALDATNTPDETNAAQIFPSPTLAELSIRTGIATGRPDPAFLQLWGGQDNAASGSGVAPFAQLVDFHHDSPVDMLISGNINSTDNTGSAHTWQRVGAAGAAAFAASWSAASVINTLTGVPLQYKLMPDDTVWIYGLATPAAGAGHTIFTLPAGYFPTTQASNSVGLANTAPVNYNTDPGTGFFQVSTVTAGATYLVDARIPLKHFS